MPVRNKSSLKWSLQYKMYGSFFIAATRSKRTYKCQSAQQTSVDPDISDSDCKLLINFTFRETTVCKRYKWD